MYIFLIVVQEQFCFGEEITDGRTSLETLPINITRNNSNCSVFLTLTLSFEDNGTFYSEFM